jgi:hypothetical protein
MNRPPERALQKRAELERIFSDVTQRRDEALADVKKHGLVLLQDKFSARGELYQVRVVNPALKVVQTCERQLCSLAKLLTAAGPEHKGNKSSEDLLREAEALLSGAN